MVFSSSEGATPFDANNTLIGAINATSGVIDYPQ
jgi:hypothetical protein